MYNRKPRTHARMHADKLTHTHTTRTHTHTYTHIRTPTQKHAHTHNHARTQAHTNAHTYTYKYTSAKTGVLALTRSYANTRAETPAHTHQPPASLVALSCTQHQINSTKFTLLHTRTHAGKHGQPYDSCVILCLIVHGQPLQCSGPPHMQYCK